MAKLKSHHVLDRGEQDKTASDVIPLKRPFWDCSKDDTISQARFNWEEGEGERESIEPKFTAKRRPIGKEGKKDTAERVEVLLPMDVMDAYLDPDILLASYEASGLRDGETLAFAQINLRHQGDVTLHHFYEASRAWLYANYVIKRGLPLLLVLHAPFRVGSENAPHVHAMVLPRRLTRHGWGALDFALGSDRDRAAARTSWRWVVGNCLATR